jgi:protein phosphatase
VEGTGSDEHVAVFRGLDVSLVGFDLFEVEEGTDLAVADLTHAARSRVRGGITADDAADAARILDALREQRLPVCPSGGTGKAGSDGGASSSAPSSSASPSTPARPTGTDVAPTTTPSRTLGTTTPARTTASSEPGVDCREDK